MMQVTLSIRCGLIVGFTLSWRRKFMKKVWVLMPAVASMALAGCGSSTAQASSSKHVTLLVTEWTNPPAIQATKTIDKLFEKKYPNVHVRLRYAPTANGAWASLYKTTMDAKTVDVAAVFAPGNFVPPSYMNMPVSGVLAYAAANQLVNFANYAWMKEDFIPGVQKKMIGYKNGIWGVNLASYGNAGVFYNKTLFKKYNLSVPTTYNQLLRVCKILKSHNITPFFVGAKDGMENMISQALFQSLTPRSNTLKAELRMDYLFWHKKESYNSDPVFKKVLTRYETLATYFQKNAFGQSQLTAPGIWASSNHYGMLVDGSWDGTTIHQANKSLKFGWFPLPGSNHASQNKMFVGGDFTWTVPTFAPQKKWAIRYVKFFSEPQNYKIWDNLVGSVPSEKISSNLPWMNIENKDLSRAQGEISLQMPINAGPKAALLNDLPYLKPEGSYTVNRLISVATQQFQAAVP